MVRVKCQYYFVTVATIGVPVIVCVVWLPSVGLESGTYTVLVYCFLDWYSCEVEI